MKPEGGASNPRSDLREKTFHFGSLKQKIPKRKKISFSGFRYEIERNTIDYTGSALSAARTGSGFPENPEGLVAENRRALDFAARRHGGVAGRLIEAVIA